MSGIGRDSDLIYSTKDWDIHSSNKTDQVVLGKEDPKNDTKFNVYVNLDFKILKDKNVSDGPIYKVDYVQTDANKLTKGMASSLYSALNELGIVMLSDNMQYNGGGFLWKHIAKDSKSEVFIYDTVSKEYLSDDNGIPIQYNGSNIPDTDIWGETGSVSHQHIVLISRSEIPK